MEYDEGRLESELERTESQTERIESRLQELEQKVTEIESAIAELSGKQEADQRVLESLEQSKANNLRELENVKQEAGQIQAELANVDAQIRAVDGWNEEAAQVLGRLQAFEDVSAAANRVADRQRWVEQQDGRCSQLRERLRRVTESAGHG